MTRGHRRRRQRSGWRSQETFALQPLSVQAQTGLNIALGVAAIPAALRAVGIGLTGIDFAERFGNFQHMRLQAPFFKRCRGAAKRFVNPPTSVFDCAHVGTLNP